MPKSHGPRRKSRHVLKKKTISRGVSFLLTKYEVGDKVVINLDPREHKTMPHRRYQGQVGVIKSIGRRTLRVGVELANKPKILQTRFNHVKPFESDREI
jgi:large subunit ribosomal protein L21e